MKILEIKKRVYQVNEQLLKMGYSFAQIESFWNETINEVKNGTQLELF